jgi:hypothetical protein
MLDFDMACSCSFELSFKPVWLYGCIDFILNPLLLEFSGSCRHITKRNASVETKDA